MSRIDPRGVVVALYFPRVTKMVRVTGSIPVVDWMPWMVCALPGLRFYRSEYAIERVSLTGSTLGSFLSKAESKSGTKTSARHDRCPLPHLSYRYQGHLIRGR